jgi:site-specific recombinase XerD
MTQGTELIPAEEAAARQQVTTLLSWERMATRAYSENTRRAWRADWAIFQAFCTKLGTSSLPVDPMIVREFVLECVRAGKKPATIHRYLATITRAHQAIRELNPCESEPVRLAIQEMKLTTSARQRQARAVGRTEIEDFLKNAGEGIRAIRERALLCVAYDTMARRSEIIAMNLADLTLAPDGTGSMLIRRSKTDQKGEGASSYLSQETIKHLKLWIDAAGITEGAIFRRLHGRNHVGERLHAQAIADIFKRVARWVGWPAKHVKEVSGHSIRVGATQDLLALNIDLASVMQAGRWKSTAMPMRYGENILAARGGMARAAELQGRNVGEFAVPDKSVRQ